MRGRDAARKRLLELLDRALTPVIAAHAGIGAWGVFYQNEDGTKAMTAGYD